MWTGRTRFTLIPEPSGIPGYKYHGGRLTKIRESDKPDNIFPETWSAMSPGQRKNAIEKWKELKPIRDACRITRGVPAAIRPEDLQDYKEVVRAACKKLTPIYSPMMPCLDVTEPSDCLLYTSPSPRDGLLSRMPSSA